MLRSTFAIVAGFFVTVTLSLGADALARAVWLAFAASEAVRNPAPLLVALVYTAGCVTVGAYVAAASASTHPMRHALLLSVIALVTMAVSTLITWPAAPLWYHIIANAMVLPCAWIGGKLREQQLAIRVSRRAAV